MEYDPGWPVCDRCGGRVRRYELAWVEHADGRRSLFSVCELDARSRRDAVRIWHEPCYLAGGDTEPRAPAPAGDRTVRAGRPPARRRRAASH